MLKNFKPVNLILVVGAMALPVSAYADLVPEKLDVSISLQSGKVTGVVEDNFGPVAGASVVVKGTTNGTITDMNGNFSLEGVNNGDLIQISFIGYMTQELIYKGQAISVKLAEDTQKLDEVVVTALGMKRSEKSLGYAMKEIKGDELNANLINPVAALQGKVAGLEISGSDGGMFGSSKVQIRSASTLGKNNQPIYVIDGVILDNSIKEGNPDWDSNPNDYGNELKNLNPDDFESVSVLKGAAATALYGSRGLNGAIVITTKSGKSGQGLGINISQSFGMDVITQTPSFQNEFGNGIIAGNVDYGDKNANGDYYIYDNFGQYPTNANGQFSLMNDQGMSWGPAFDGREIQYYDGSTRAYSPVKNNFHKAYQKGFSSNTNVAISGGNEKTTFYTSLSYKHVDGTTPNNSFDRISFLGKASHMFHPKIKLEASMSFANSMPKNSPINIGENFASGVWGRSYDPSTAKDKYKGVHGGLASSSYGDEYGNMPGIGTWWSVYENDYRQKEISVRPVVKLNIDLLDWLKFNVKGSYNYYYTRFENKQPGSGYANEGGYYGIGQTTKEQTNLNANFMFNKTFGDFTVNGFLHGEFYENFQQAQSMNTNGGLIAPNQYFIENSKQTPTYGAKVEDRKKMLSVAFQVGVNWKDQIFLDVTGRNDWSSTLVYADGHGSYSYFYPSVNGSWLISSTYRDQLPEWISFAKIRGSWAQVGNDTSPYIINTAYQINTSTLNGTNYYGMSLPGTMYDQDLKPERKNAWEIGLDWRFLNNRIGLDATYYKENTKDQIMEISVPAVSGITKQLINAGNIQNKGVELALNTIPFQNQDWEWTLDFTWTKNMNKIVELHENVADYITLAGDVAYGNYRIGSVDVTGRNDWSSTLVYADGHGSYSYFYPSVNGSWLISSTYRDQLPEWISFAKIRGSWAQVGNDTSPYIINTAYQINTSTLNGTNYYGMSLPGTMYDQDLKPERKNAWEIGLDWRFLNNRIGLDATYYKENTKDQIMEISVPAVSGITKQLINAGNIQNKGVELALNTIPFQNQDWEWTLDFTWTKNMNKIVELHENVADYITLAGDVAYGNYRIGSVAKVGASYGTLMTDSYYNSISHPVCPCWFGQTGHAVLITCETKRRSLRSVP